MKYFGIVLFVFYSVFSEAQSREIISFNEGWRFAKEEVISDKTASYRIDFNDKDWEFVTLPHSAHIEPLPIIAPWQGACLYRKSFIPSKKWKGKKIYVEFEGAMQTAIIRINGQLVLTHQGGYLPFIIDLSSHLVFDQANVLSVELYNQANPQVPPGKPLNELDFCYYSGLYRNVKLIVTDQLHITDACYEDKAGGGGIFITCPFVTKSKAIVNTLVHIRNERTRDTRCYARIELMDHKNRVVASCRTADTLISQGNDFAFSTELAIDHPSLWHPDHPYLYTLRVALLDGQKEVDLIDTRIGIRKFAIDTNKQFRLNDEPLYLYGTNRHQEYPFIGNALSDHAQYRDAWKIKAAGLNFVRLSHYPQSPAFMKACDELGLLVMDCIPGWQFAGDSLFRENSYRDARMLIRRDRNHACVALWELSLNESAMSDSYMEEMVRIAREESPATKLLTCGWKGMAYDVFTPARQHANAPDFWKLFRDRPFLTAEYGDWEYYAQNAGFNQGAYKDLKPEERSSRQLRGAGEKRLLQQALNFQEAHNDNLRSRNLGDAFWLMFDYSRGYSPDIESSGIMDVFRLPKFSYYFYQSQRPILHGPVLKIASYWIPSSSPYITVYSNCDEVALFLNGRLIERKKAASSVFSDQLPYPPFQFNLSSFQAGKLKAVGYIRNKAVITDEVATPGKPARIQLQVDESGKKLTADGADKIFVYALICDENGRLVSDAENIVTFTVKGGGYLTGANPVRAEAGIASFLLGAGTSPETILITAESKGLRTANKKIKPVRNP